MSQVVRFQVSHNNIYAKSIRRFTENSRVPRSHSMHVHRMLARSKEREKKYSTRTANNYFPARLLGEKTLERRV